jgi:prevent-host-death family protein
MTTVNMHEAGTHLSRLVDRAVRGEPFVIAKAGTPLVRVTAVDAPPAPQRLGFLEGEIRVPDDFDRMGADVIAALFGSDGAAGSRQSSPEAPPRPPKRSRPAR